MAIQAVSPPHLYHQPLVIWPHIAKTWRQWLQRPRLNLCQSLAESVRLRCAMEGKEKRLVLPDRLTG
ncbi:hypothetical protein PoMZ_11623 [Pyricularia oryzae]|uniref:Uncharacterized protein n=1 Tax=Pyricularia oryzae TaxID=318829 RepID=A0A4P7NL01_PYROR|nr:hypothetical protein PoMZ_11623 [Pyricularia oryzae]